MIELNYTVHFNTPAFLGNAEQSAQWRTPPFKALLRQWWRVAWAAEQRFLVRVDEMRNAEAELFGSAADDDRSKSGRSKVRIRLSKWQVGVMTRWEGLPPVSHPEVRFPVGSDLYLGYGPLKFENRMLGLKGNAAIQAGESATLSLAYPADTSVDRALGLLQLYGTLGGRSRNGWGSFALKPDEHNPATAPLVVPLRPWRDCLDRDWAHAIGSDEQGALIWQTVEHANWKAVLVQLAQLKIGLRTQFKFPHAQPDGQVHPRHWLSYPVTKHAVFAWGNNARLPNSLRFKVRAVGHGRYVGVVFHVPHLPPVAFRPNTSQVQTVWEKVHLFLDAQTHNNPAALSRIAE